MITPNPEPELNGKPHFQPPRHPHRDIRLLFTTRIVRLFSFGLISVILVLYLAASGLDTGRIGLLLTLTLAGDTLISLWITTRADRIGRRRMLLAGALLMVVAGAVFALTRSFPVLLFAAMIGVISPSGNEVGPFLPIEQAALAQTLRNEQRIHVFAWYNLVGSFATAIGSLVGGGLAQVLQVYGFSPLDSYKAIVLGYGLLGTLLALLFTRLSGEVEANATVQNPSFIPSPLGLHRSRNVILRLSALFSLDAFAGGFVVQSIVAYWFNQRFGVEPAVLGGIFFGANLLAGFSALGASRLAARFGLVNTMVFTHIPSNLLLILVPLMPNLPAAIAILLLRFSISQMDVPTRQSYTMAVVAPEERSAAAGITGVARTMGASISPVFAGIFLANTALLSLPFFISGSLKIGYDLALYRLFRTVGPEKESAYRHPSS